MANAYTPENYLAALNALLPTGPAFARQPDSIQTRVLSGIAYFLWRIDAAANALLVDAFPLTTVGLLPEWEASLGLPDPCAGPTPTMALRRAQVLTRLVGGGSLSIPYYIGLAAKLGYSVDIATFAPFRMGQSVMGNALGGPEWAFTWQITAPLLTIKYFEMGISGMGEPLRSWGNSVLECEIAEYKPAYTNVFFHYL
jgi:uncharacterized protein YmfQ (DUF2313 family)